MFSCSTKLFSYLPCSFLSSSWLHRRFVFFLLLSIFNSSFIQSFYPFILFIFRLMFQFCFPTVTSFTNSPVSFHLIVLYLSSNYYGVAFPFIHQSFIFWS